MKIRRMRRGLAAVAFVAGSLSAIVASPTPASAGGCVPVAVGDAIVASHCAYDWGQEPPRSISVVPLWSVPVPTTHENTFKPFHEGGSYRCGLITWLDVGQTVGGNPTANGHTWVCINNDRIPIAPVTDSVNWVGGTLGDGYRECVDPSLVPGITVSHCAERERLSVLPLYSVPIPLNWDQPFRGEGDVRCTDFGWWDVGAHAQGWHWVLNGNTTVCIENDVYADIADSVNDIAGEYVPAELIQDLLE